MSEKLVQAIAARALGLRAPLRIARVAGGDINEAFAVRGAAGGAFVKLNRRAPPGLFEAERAALAELRATATVTVPAPLAHGVRDGVSFLALELLEFGRHDAHADIELGASLARLHRIDQPFFGWHRDNFIGRTPQPNPRAADWIEFFAVHRIGFQIELLGRRGGPATFEERFESLRGRMAALFEGYRPRPSLLHGDLWGGNRGTLSDGRPVVFDPASYYGCRETDLAMTELFGGFGPGFYRAYEAEWPLDPGYQRRRRLYQLYHVLNHANLFGGGYLDQALRLLEEI